MNTSIITLPQEDNSAALIPYDASGHQKHRLQHFAEWLDRNAGKWYMPDLGSYARYIQSEDREIIRRDRHGRLVGLEPAKGLSARSAAAHLSTIRGRYHVLMTDNRIRDRLYRLAPADADGLSRKAFVDEIMTRLSNAVDPQSTKGLMRVIKSQDRIDTEQLRLTKAQSNALLNAPKQRADNTALQALRDTALIGLLLCTGLREAELCALEVEDLRQTVEGEIGVHVREGKGMKERFVPYGDLAWSLATVDKWLTAAGIVDGDGNILDSAYVYVPKTKQPDKNNPDHWKKTCPVSRAFWKGGKKVRPSRLTNNAVNAILNQYPIVISGKERRVKPHDCRRTYARRMYEADVPVVVIQQNLGHSDLKTTLGYIGKLDMDARRPPAIYDQPDLSELNGLL